jgi:hypothetical protein
VVTTPFERIEEDGDPDPRDRWNTAAIRNTGWQVLGWNTRVGRYRSFFVFYGTNVAMNPSPSSFGDVGGMTETELHPLPNYIRNRVGGAASHIKVYIYEYVRPSSSEPPRRVVNLPTHEHLARSGVGPRLNAICSG